jgi:plasmid maintenance system antidote protein VapI
VLTLSSTNVRQDADSLGLMDQPKPSDVFSANLSKILAHQTLSVNAAANAWKIPQKTLESFVKKGRVPSIDTADRVAEAAGYHLWQMLQEHFDPSNPPVMQPVTPEEKAFHVALKALIKTHPKATS